MGGSADWRIYSVNPSTGQSANLYLVLVPRWDGMATPAACFIRLGAADHDRRRVVARRLAADESLVAARRIAAHDADRVQLVDDFGDREQLRHRTERLAAEVSVG